MELLERSFDRARRAEARAVFTSRDERAARTQAAAADAAVGRSEPSLLTGLPVSIKDLFDVAGQVTSAGSRVLLDAPPAAADCEIVKRLRAAGAVVVGRTNMTEFAFSGLGLNPHFGTPLNPCWCDEERIPGGSSSGAAVSVALGAAIAAVGTDTGGSVRIPAALCGLVGFKPTAARVPMRGVLPLSPTLDSVGPIARTVQCCAAVDAVLAGETCSELAAIDLASLRLAVARDLVWENIDSHVQSAVSEALNALGRAGVQLIERNFPALEEIVALNASGGFPAFESYEWHRDLLRERARDYDPRVRVRIERGAGLSVADRENLVRARTRLRAEFERELAGVHAWVMPTVPRIAPRLDALGTDEAYFATNGILLRNPSLVNFLDGCAVSLPCHAPGTAPVGLSLVGAHGEDRRLLATAQAIARVIDTQRHGHDTIN